MPMTCGAAACDYAAIESGVPGSALHCGTYIPRMHVCMHACMHAYKVHAYKVHTEMPNVSRLFLYGHGIKVCLCLFLLLASLSRCRLLH
jgi:hypothetical protein